ncbi:fimbrial biogenesis chaperone [Carnimonas bestiolae]|uniref:fimbrial biogenesis chaperone n=1 Tax=Carnimonas bestiolae TaxID=3402172 RepID=UPI003EDC5B1C
MRYIKHCIAIGLALIAGWAITGAAYGAIQLQATRVVYDGSMKAATLGLKNDATRPYMVQSWLDTGDQTQMPKQLPIVVTPPLMKLTPGRSSSLRFIYSGSGLPSDKESLLWINVQEIPPASDQENVLQIAIRSRIKLFYRPAGIATDLDKAAHSLEWHRQGHALVVHNPSALHITFAALKPGHGATVSALSNDMVAPGATVKVLEGGVVDSDFAHPFGVDYVNDYGGYSHLDGVLAAPL